jgi:hypothetical protein
VRLCRLQTGSTLALDRVESKLHVERPVVRATTILAMKDSSALSACSSFNATRMSRRHVLKVGGMGLLGLTMPKLLRAAALASKNAPKARAKSVIFLFQYGGPSHIDMFDMKPNAPEQIRGTAQADLVERGWHSSHREVAARFEDHGQGHAHPLHDAHDEESQLGRAITRSRATRRRVMINGLRDSMDLYPAYGSGRGQARADSWRHADVRFVSARDSRWLDHSPGSTRVFSGRCTIRCSSVRTRTARTSRCRN